MRPSRQAARPRRRPPTRARPIAPGARGGRLPGCAAGRGRRSRASRAGGRTRGPRPPRARALLELARREAAPAQVGRQLGRAALDEVVALGVALDAVASQACMRARAAASPGAERVGTSSPARARRPRDRRPASHARGQRRSSRGAPWTSRRSSCRHARQNGEKTANGRPSFVRGCRRRRTARMGTARPGLAQRRAHAAVAGQGERRDVARPKCTASAPVCAPARAARALGPPVAHDEVARRGRAAPRAARAGSRAGSGARGRTRSGPCSSASSSTKTGRRGRLAGGRGQGRVVVDAQVAPEPDDRGACSSRIRPT